MATAVSLCDRVISTAFDGVDVLDRRAVEARLQDVLFAYAACMRSNGPTTPTSPWPAWGRAGACRCSPGWWGARWCCPRWKR